MRRIERMNVRMAGCVAAIASSVVVTGAGAQPQSCGSDLNRDGVINGADLGVLLGQWGANGGRHHGGQGHLSQQALGEGATTLRLLHSGRIHGDAVLGRMIRGCDRVRQSSPSLGRS